MYILSMNSTYHRNEQFTVGMSITVNTYNSSQTQTYSIIIYCSPGSSGVIAIAKTPEKVPINGVESYIQFNYWQNISEGNCYFQAKLIYRLSQSLSNRVTFHLEEKEIINEIIERRENWEGGENNNITRRGPEKESERSGYRKKRLVRKNLLLLYTCWFRRR